LLVEADVSTRERDSGHFGAALDLSGGYGKVARISSPRRVTGLVTAPGYGLADANLQLTDIGNTRLTVTLFVNNLTDTVYLRIPGLAARALAWQCSRSARHE
jgi:outer membrane receptor protein involved in Fe transport